MKIAVIGMGYVGLPLAVTFAEAGVEVVGIEADPKRCHAINAGDSYIVDVTDEALKAVVDKGLLTATTDYARHRELRRRHHLPADAAQRQPRTRPDARQGGHRQARRSPAPRPARVPREHDLPGHHPRGARAAPRAGLGAHRRHRLPPRLLARTGRPGAHRLHHQDDAQGRRRPDAGLHQEGARGLRPGDRCTSCRSPPPKWPR